MLNQKQEKRIGIGLFGKGSTNHLHRPDIVAAFRSQGLRISFIVREDYLNLLTKIDGCDYLPVRVLEESGLRAPILHACQNIRKLYPAKDLGQLRVHEARNSPQKMRPWSPAYLWLNRLAARYRNCAAIAAWIEDCLSRPELVQGIDATEFDLLILLGIGTVHSELEGAVTRWAEHHQLPCMHVIGNYDHVSSKGFRGISPKQLLVWGPQMLEDAVAYQGIAFDRVKVIGSLRYNSINKDKLQNPEEFLKSIGLETNKKTIVFAGYAYASQYYEVLAMYRDLLASGVQCQLILRLYPNKTFMNSIYIEPLIHYAKSLPHTYISFADPHFLYGYRDKEVLQVEEDELWNILNSCDVLVDYYSTITLEGAIFNKPIIHMHYLPQTAQPYLSKLIPLPTWDQIHSRRILASGAVQVAHNRQELMTEIHEAFRQPVMLADARKNLVTRECGPLDSQASERLLRLCRQAINDFQQRHAN